jgi:hypothetical protein
VRLEALLRCREGALRLLPVHRAKHEPHECSQGRYGADAIDVATLKREQSRINAEVAEAESQLAQDGEKLAQAKQIIDLALDLAEDCAASYRKARPEVRKMWNRPFFRTIRVRECAIAGSGYEEPFASLLGSHEGSMVDPRGLEPLTSWLPAKRSTS